MARDGQPISEKELVDQDKKQEEKMARREARQAARSEAERARREEEKRREERAVIDEVFLMDDFRITRREMVEGRPTIVFAFAPKPGYKPVTEGGKLFAGIYALYAGMVVLVAASILIAPMFHRFIHRFRVAVASDFGAHCCP